MARIVAGGMRGRRAAASLLAVSALLAGVGFARPARAADNVVLQLGGPAQFRYAGYYAALWHGLYVAAGLAVQIRPGSSPGEPAIDPAREVVDGRAQFGVGDAGVVVHIGQGAPLLLLAPIFQRSGAAIYYRSDADFPSPSALAGARVGRLAASDLLDVEMVSALRGEGVDPTRLKSVALRPDGIVAALAERTVDAAPGSAWTVPWQARAKNLALKSFNPADYRVEFYGDTLFTTRRLEQAQPGTVSRFRTASLQGWEYAFQHPDEIIEGLLTEPSASKTATDPAGLARYQTELARRLARYPEVRLGHSNPDRWRRIAADLAGTGALSGGADISPFVYDPGLSAADRPVLGGMAALSGTLLLGALLAMAMWWRRYRRNNPTPVRAEPEPVLALASAGKPVLPGGELNRMLSGFEATLRQIEPHRSVLRLSLRQELWPCHADPRLLRELVLDVFVGALADIPSGGGVIVGTRNIPLDAAAAAEMPEAVPGDYVRVTVKDAGPGFSLVQLEDILDPGVTMRPAVAAAAQALRRIGGFVRVESAEGVGTAVHFFLPRAVEVAATARAQAAA